MVVYYNKKFIKYKTVSKFKRMVTNISDIINLLPYYNVLIKMND